MLVLVYTHWLTPGWGNLVFGVILGINKLHHPLPILGNIGSHHTRVGKEIMEVQLKLNNPRFGIAGRLQSPSHQLQLCLLCVLLKDHESANTHTCGSDCVEHRDCLALVW